MELGRATESMECGTIPAGNLPAELFPAWDFPGFFKDFRLPGNPGNVKGQEKSPGEAGQS